MLSGDKTRPLVVVQSARSHTCFRLSALAQIHRFITYIRLQCAHTYRYHIQKNNIFRQIHMVVFFCVFFLKSCNQILIKTFMFCDVRKLIYRVSAHQAWLIIHLYLSLEKHQINKPGNRLKLRESTISEQNEQKTTEITCKMLEHNCSYYYCQAVQVQHGKLTQMSCSSERSASTQILHVIHELQTKKKQMLADVHTFFSRLCWGLKALRLFLLYRSPLRFPGPSQVPNR